MTQVTGDAVPAGSTPTASTPETRQTATPAVRYPVPALTLPDGTQVVTILNAAKLTGRSRRTIYNWIQRGLVEVVWTPSGQKRVKVASLFKEARPDGIGRVPAGSVPGRVPTAKGQA